MFLGYDVFAPVHDRIPAVVLTVLFLPCGLTLLGVYLIGKQKGRQHAHTHIHTQPFAIAVKKGSPVSQDLLSQGIQSTFHDASSPHGIPKCKCEPCTTSRKLKVSLGACTGQLVTCIPMFSWAVETKSSCFFEYQQ